MTNHRPQGAIVNPCAGKGAIIRRLIALPAVIAASAALVATSHAQSVVQNVEEEPLELSPFVVSSSKDVGYQATSSLAGTRINTELRDLGAAISVVTQEFLQDTGATSMADLLVYTTGTEVGGPFGNFTNSSFTRGRADQEANRVNPESNTRIRGLVSTELSRDFFITDFGFDSFNIERIDISRGPNSILFGVGSPGGVIDYTLKRASLAGNKHQVSVRLGERGTYRETADFNRVLIDDRLALRVALLNEEENYKQEPAFERDQRIHASLEAVLREGSRSGALGSTILRANFEHAKVNGTPTNVVAPTDNIYYWYNLPDVAAIEAQTGQSAPAVYKNGTFVPQSLHNRFGGNPPYRGNPAQLQPWFITLGMVYRDATNGGGPNIGFSDPAISDVSGLVGRVVGRFDWLMQTNIVEEAWTSGFTARTFQDTGIYDFQNQLITGNTESRDDKFNNMTASLEQLLFGGKGGFELAYNRQELNRRDQFSFSDSRSWDVWLDNNLWLSNGAPNPNVGRAFMVSRDYGKYNIRENDRDTTRATAFYELDFRDVAGDRFGRWLGRHSFTGLAERSTREVLSRSWRNAHSSNEIDMERAVNANIAGARRQLHGGFYFGPDLRNVANYADVRLSGYINVPRVQNGDTFRAYLRDQGDNQDKYITAFVEEYLDAGSRSRRVIDSQAFSWQSYLFDDYLVGLFGYRKDKVRDTLNIGGPRLPDNTFDPATLALDDTPSLDDSGRTYTWSVVGHFPEKYIRELPLGADLSVFYNASENFQPTGFRQDVFLNSIAPPTGETKEYGFLVSLKENRFSVRVNWFETKVNNVSLDTNLATRALGPATTWINRQVEAQRIGVPFGFDVNGRETGIAEFYDSYDELLNVLLNDIIPEPIRTAANLRLGGGGVGIQNALVDEVPGLASTSNFIAKGTEIEFTANPTDNWRIALNIARQETTQSGSGLDLQQYYGQIRQNLIDANLWDTDIADEPNVSGNITFRQRFTRDFLNPLAAITAQDGTVSQEQREWRANLVTAYRFKNGFLRDFEIGGAARWQDKGAVGYPLLLVESEGDTIQVPDLARPYYAPAMWNGDVFVRYHRKLFDRVNWTIQLQLRNYLGDQDLIPEVINPDGSRAVVRIPVEKGIYVTNTFDF